MNKILFFTLSLVMAITAYGQNSASVDTLQTGSDSTSVGSHAEFSAARQESNVTKAEGDSASIKTKAETLRREAETAKKNSDFNKAAEIEYGKLPELLKQEEELKARWEKMVESGTLLKNSVDEEMIATIVSKWTGIPVNKMLQGEKAKVLAVEDHLRKEVVGQDAAIKSSIGFPKIY
jgi:ATP-dependent Clp protease ATP-binding subunit ClpA